MEFKEFRQKLIDHFNMIASGKKHLYLTDVSRDELWDTYLESFPPGTNEIFRERREFDCNCCKQFIRPYSNLVVINNKNEMVSIWDIPNLQHPFDKVAETLSKKVKAAKIKDVLVQSFSKMGVSHNLADEEGTIRRWEHLHLMLPKEVRKSHSVSPEALMGEYRSGKDVFLRALSEISEDAINTTLELIEQNSLYRGSEYKASIVTLLKFKKEFSKIKNNRSRDNFAWANSIDNPQIARIRNSAIGTLLVDISNDVELDRAVRSFESIMAPTNYKRPQAIVTKRMIEDAKKKVEELGLKDSLGRRFATEKDITVDNVIFTDKTFKKKPDDVFEELEETIVPAPKTFDRVDEVTIEDFINDIVPKASNIELLVKSDYEKNMMSLISPLDNSAPSLFKWDNAFSWCYNNNLTDSIKERVKAAGGSVVGDFRASLSWFNYDDLDIHITEPDNNKIYYSNRQSYKTKGKLDVDMNAGGGKSRTPVENIIYPSKNTMLIGNYKISVNNYRKRETSDVGFTVECEFGGGVHTFNYEKAVPDGRTVKVATVHYDGKNFTIKDSLPSSSVTKEIWGIKSNNFEKVKLILNSPNHWNGKAVGNKHYFFIIDNCKNPETPRGFFNEFLKEDLLKQKRVFEALGNKMTVEASDNQLSGVGFSDTQKNEAIVRVTGAFSRILKVKF